MPHSGPQGAEPVPGQQPQAESGGESFRRAGRPGGQAAGCPGGDRGIYNRGVGSGSGCPGAPGQPDCPNEVL